MTAFDTGFRTVRDALSVSTPSVRQAAMPVLFGDFTRRVIAAGFDRTRFVEWFGPEEIVKAPAGRMRGRVLYFNNAKGRGKVLGSDGHLYFVHFSMIRGNGFRSLDGGQLVEFSPQSGTFNGIRGAGAYDVARLVEGGDTEVPARKLLTGRMQPTALMIKERRLVREGSPRCASGSDAAGHAPSLSGRRGSGSQTLCSPL